MSNESRTLHTYHIYIDLFGEESLFAPLYEYLHELHAVKLHDYPIWHFTGRTGDSNVYAQKIGKILEAISVNNQGLGLVETRWRILLIGDNGHSGFGRGLTPEQYENFLLKNLIK